MVTPAARQEAAAHACPMHGGSQRRVQILGPIAQVCVIEVPGHLTWNPGRT